jgi:hypothetical protein
MMMMMMINQRTSSQRLELSHKRRRRVKALRWLGMTLGEPCMHSHPGKACFDGPRQDEVIHPSILFSLANARYNEDNTLDAQSLRSSDGGEVVHLATSYSGTQEPGVFNH